MYDMTLAELVQSKPITSIAAEDYAILLRDKIDHVTDLETELQEACRELADMSDQQEEIDKLRGALGQLVDAIKNSRVGKLRKVGALVIVEGNDSLTVSANLGEAMKTAEALL